MQKNYGKFSNMFGTTYQPVFLKLQDSVPMRIDAVLKVKAGHNK